MDKEDGGEWAVTEVPLYLSRSAWWASLVASRAAEKQESPPRPRDCDCGVCVVVVFMCGEGGVGEDEDGERGGDDGEGGARKTQHARESNFNACHNFEQ